MTKKDEIELLSKTIMKFGPYSYIGPWLKDLQGDIVYAIKNDIPIKVILRREDF